MCYNINMKILSPVGNAECLKSAIYNGADEVYLGINEFNARNNVDGFNLDDIKEAVDFAHVYGVKVHLAINILFSDDELQGALDTVVTCYNYGVDAFIIQDLGLIGLIHEYYPQIEIHASTQMALHNLEGVEYLKRFGVKRVVLARETPLKEIKRIKDKTGLEIEYFAQGALCVSFSGNCYMSSYLFNASGNRGRCKQLCRLPYTLIKDGKKLKSGYLLSAKDFNMSKRLKDLESAGVDAIKIEGRARRAFYVATATREYFNALNGKKIDDDALKLAFNRTYTEGYFNGNGTIISELQNHIGVKVGKVEKVTVGKKFNEIFISSNRTLYPKSTFKFFSAGKETTLTAFDLKRTAKDRYRITTTQTVAVGSVVRLIVDSNAEESTLSVTKKRMVDIAVTAAVDAPITARICVGDKEIAVSGEILTPAKSRPLSIDELKENFNKSEFFDATIKVDVLDQVFIPKSKLNEFRRDVFSALYALLTECKGQLEKIKIPKITSVKKFTEFEFIEDENQKITAKNVIYSPESYDIVKVKKLKERCEKANAKLYLDTPNFALEDDVKMLKDLIEKTGVGVVANNYYALSFSSDTVAGAGLNVYNKHSAALMNIPFITAESNISERIDFPFMTLRHCPIKAHVGGSCDKCLYSDGYEYRLESGKVMKLKRKKLSTCTFYLFDIKFIK